MVFRDKKSISKAAIATLFTLNKESCELNVCPVVYIIVKGFILVGLLYVLALLIVLHDSLMVYGLLRMPNGRKHWYSLTVGILSVLGAVFSMWFLSWEILVISFAVCRLLLMIDTIVSTWNRNRSSMILPINLLMVAGSLSAYLSKHWWIFALSYFLFWVVTYLFARQKAYHNYPR